MYDVEEDERVGESLASVREEKKSSSEMFCNCYIQGNYMNEYEDGQQSLTLKKHAFIKYIRIFTNFIYLLIPSTSLL